MEREENSRGLFRINVDRKISKENFPILSAIYQIKSLYFSNGYVIFRIACFHLLSGLETH